MQALDSKPFVRSLIGSVPGHHGRVGGERLALTLLQGGGQGDVEVEPDDQAVVIVRQ